LSENTIKTHLSHIFGKLGVQSRAEAVATALRRRLVPLNDERQARGSAA
ncbi:MAG: LuxR C-terminal-related transcriptional regulator, partial [Anaerolineae bacterium]